MEAFNRNDLDISRVMDARELTCMLAKLRLRSDLEANSKGITEDVVDGFSDAQVSALPESTIVHIVDAYFILKKKGVSDQDIFKRIDMQRSLLGQDTTVPAGVDLSGYIKWRLKAEFPAVASLEDMIVDMEILYATKWFSRSAKSKQEWSDADAFAAKAISTMRGKYLDTQSISAPGQKASTSSSASRWKWPVIALVVMAIAGSISYWLFFRGGLALLK